MFILAFQATLFTFFLLIHPGARYYWLGKIELLYNIFCTHAALTVGGVDNPTEIQAGSNPYFHAEATEVSQNSIPLS